MKATDMSFTFEYVLSRGSFAAGRLLFMGRIKSVIAQLITLRAIFQKKLTRPHQLRGINQAYRRN
jgi:hypothetical protein